MMHTKHKEALIILGGYIIKPFFYFFLNLTPTSFKKKKLIPLIVKITKCNWKIGYLITLYLSHYVKQLFNDENFVISTTRFGYYLKVPVTDNHFLYRLVGLYHPEKFLNSIEKEIKGCKHICEIGTHLGELSAWFKNIQPLSKFTAFELHPEFTKFVQDSFNLNHFSKAIESDTLNDIKKIVVDLEIGAKHGDSNINLVVSDTKGEFYKSYNFRDFIYEQPRKMSICFDITKSKNKSLKTYIWNSNTDSKSVIKKMTVSYYTY